MSVIAVTRHAGARQWLAEQGIHIDQMVEHLSIDAVRAGDVIVGTLPVHLAAEVCSRGARYLHLTLNVPPEARGRELDAADMRAFGARLAEYRVEPVK